MEVPPQPESATPRHRRVLVVAAVALASIAFVLAEALLVGGLTAARVSESSSPTWGIDVLAGDLKEGSCISDSYIGSAETPKPGFTFAAATYRVVDCTHDHVAEVLTKVPIPVAQAWVEYGTEDGPSEQAANDWVRVVCNAYRSGLNEFRAAKDELKDAEITVSLAAIGARYLGYCMLHHDRSVDRAWADDLVSFARSVKPLAVESARTGDEPVAGTCLESYNGIDVDWASAIDCTEDHLYDVIEVLELPEEFGSDEQAYARMTGQGDFDEADLAWRDWAEPGCWEAAAAETGLDSVAVGAVLGSVNDAPLAARPLGQFTLDISLPPSADFLYGDRRVLCSVLWLDLDLVGSVVSHDNGIGFADYYGSGLSMEAYACYVNEFVWDDQIDCSGPHGLQSVASFDAAAVFDADWLAAVRESGVPTAEQQVGLDRVCSAFERIAIGVPDNRWLEMTAHVAPENWPVAAGYHEVDCLLELPDGPGRYQYSTGNWFGLGTSPPTWPTDEQLEPITGT